MPRAVAYTRVPLIVCLRDTLCCGEYRDFYLTDKRRGRCGTLFFFCSISFVYFYFRSSLNFRDFLNFFPNWFLGIGSTKFYFYLIEEDFWGSLTRWNMNFFLNDRVWWGNSYFFLMLDIALSLNEEFRISIVFNGICLITCKLFF